MMPQPTEAEFLAQVLALAQICGWRTLHVRPGRTARGGWRTPVQGNGKGWPDVFAVRGPRCLAAELKVKGKITPEQQAWLLALGGAGVEVKVWRPSDWASIEATLKREE